MSFEIPESARRALEEQEQAADEALAEMEAQALEPVSADVEKEEEANARRAPAGSAHARATDPGTSHAAARSIPFEKLRASQRAVFICFQTYGPMAHDTLVARYATGVVYGWPQQSVSGLRTRTSELVQAGWLKDSGQVVILPSGRQSTVWMVA